MVTLDILGINRKRVMSWVRNRWPQVSNLKIEVAVHAKAAVMLTVVVVGSRRHIISSFVSSSQTFFLNTKHVCNYSYLHYCYCKYYCPPECVYCCPASSDASGPSEPLPQPTPEQCAEEESQPPPPLPERCQAHRWIQAGLRMWYLQEHYSHENLSDYRCEHHSVRAMDNVCVHCDAFRFNK